MLNKKLKFNDGWSYALINNRIAEIWFAKDIGIYAYGFLDQKKRSKREQKMINQDIKNYQFSYRNKTFRDKIKNVFFPLGEMKYDLRECEGPFNSVEELFKNLAI